MLLLKKRKAKAVEKNLKFEDFGKLFFRQMYQG